MNFNDPIYLYLLLLIPLLIALYIFTSFRRRRKIAAYGDPELIKAYIPKVSTVRSRITFWLSLFAFTLIVFALARPRFGSKKETITTKGVEVVVAIDVSNSMLAKDIYPNRLDKAKKLVSRIFSRMKGNKVALVVFAGDAFVQLPITDDHISAEFFLDEIDTKMVSRQGTDMGAAITLATESFSKNDKIGKAIVLITDAEDHEDGAIAAAKIAAEKGIKLYVMGIGTEKGDRIPMGGKDNYLRDKNGEMVRTKLNPEVGKKIAEAGKGVYINADNSTAAQEFIEKEFDKLSKDEVKSEVYTKFKEQYVYIALLAFIFLFLDCITNAVIDFISDSRKNKKYMK